MGLLRSTFTTIELYEAYARMNIQINENELKFNKQFKNFRSKKKALKAKMAVKVYKEYLENILITKENCIETIHKFLDENGDLVKAVYSEVLSGNLTTNELAKKKNVDVNLIEEIVYLFKKVEVKQWLIIS